LSLLDYLVEVRKKNVIVVDIQPEYKSYIRFDMEECMNFLNSQRDLLVFFNGPDTVGQSSSDVILRWWYQQGFDLHNYKKTVRWIDKGYGFFRTWMDQGVDEKRIQEVVRYMVMNRISDSRLIPDDILLDFVEGYHKGVDDEFLLQDPIYLPHISLGMLKKWSGSYLIGGGRNECLKEIKILLDTFNVRYTIVKKFTF